MKKAFLVVNPHQELWQEWKEHLAWMLENHPERVRELYQAGKLKAYLDKKASLAWKMINTLLTQGKDLAEAHEVVGNALLSPPDGPAFQDNPPAPLPEPLEAEILAWAQNLPTEPPTEIWV